MHTFQGEEILKAGQCEDCGGVHCDSGFGRNLVQEKGSKKQSGKEGELYTSKNVVVVGLSKIEICEI